MNKPVSVLLIQGFNDLQIQKFTRSNTSQHIWTKPLTEPKHLVISSKEEDIHRGGDTLYKIQEPTATHVHAGLRNQHGAEKLFL